MLATLLLLATVAINAPQPIPITGQVLDAGRPHAGARVDLYTVHGDNPLGSALTRPDGSYELTAPESGAYRVVVQAKDRLSLEHLVVPLVEEAALPPVELLSPDGWRPAESPQRPEGNVTRVVTGKVVDAQTGKPVAGALVWGGLPPDLPPVRTGEDGAFRLPLPKSRRSFGVAAAGYLLSEAGPGQPEKPVTVALKKAARVQGQVVDSEGAPVAGVFLQIRPVPFQDQRLSSLRYLSELLSRADGSFSIPGLLPGGVYKLSASKPGHGKMEVEIRTAPAGRPTPSARVILGTGVTMIGRIVDETGKPVEGASVDLLQDDPTGFLQAVSDASGVFSIRGLAPGQYQLAAVRKGFSPITHSGVLMPEGPARLDLGDITLKAGAAIEGKVIDAEGRTVEGAEVQASKTQEEMNFLSLGNQQADVVTFSSKDGHFQIRDLEPGLRYSVSVRHPDYPPESLSGVEAPTAEPVTIELQPSRTLSGRVVGPDGEPVPDAEIMLVTQTGFGSYVGGMLGRTDSAGDFRGSGLRPGAIDLQISAPGYQKTAWRGIQIPRDRDPEPVIINLERGGILEVRAVDQEGNPMAEVRFHISPKARPVGGMFMGGLFEPVSGADGTFRVTGLPPGEYNVFAHASQLGRSVERTVRAGSGVTRVDLLFERGVEVSGRVVNDDGQPIPSASVQLATSSDQGSQAVGGSSQADGSFLIPSVLDGEHQLTASAKGYGKSEPRRLAVSGSRVEGIEIRLSREAGGTIVGRILGLPAEELSRFRIAADLDGNNLETAEALPDEQGRFRLPDLSAGNWDVSIHQPNGMSLSQEALVEPGAETFVEFQFPEGPTFTGRLSVDGRPLPGADLVATSLESRISFARARTDFEGKFSLGPLMPGLHSIVIFGVGNGLSAYETVRFEEGQEVRLDLETGGILGRILSPAGEPVADAAIQINAVEPSSGLAHPGFGPSIRSDAEGSFQLLSIPGGLYDLRVQKPGFKEIEAQIEIRPGPPRVQDIGIEPREP